MDNNYITSVEVRDMVAESKEIYMEKQKEIIKELYLLVWGMDIPSPGCPEYVELHEKIQRILSFIDKKLL